MKHLVKKVIAHLESQKTNLIGLGRDFQLSNAQIAQVVGKGAQGYYDMLSELYESNIDYFYSVNIESIMHILDGFLTDAEKNEVGTLETLYMKMTCITITAPILMMKHCYKLRCIVL